jgi:hypothetical protein
MAGSWEGNSLALENYFSRRLKFHQPLPILMRNNVLRQITVGQYEGN